MPSSNTPVRDHLVDALYADLVGPFAGASAHATSRELLRNPSDWYLTGFLVPESDREPPPDMLEDAGEGDDVPREDSEAEPEGTKRPKLFPASMGMSVLLPPDADLEHVTARVSFARYVEEWKKEEESAPGRGKKFWRRVPQPEEAVTVPLDEGVVRAGIPLRNTPKVFLEGRLATFADPLPGIEAGTRALSLFVVNRLPVTPSESGRTERTLFQVQLAVDCPKGFVERPNRTGLVARGDFDAKVADLQFRDHVEYAVGHNVAAEPLTVDGRVTTVRTRWIPRTDVRLVDARRVDGVTVAMEELAALADAKAVEDALGDLPALYTAWLSEEAKKPLEAERAEVRRELLVEAQHACARIRAGIDRLKADPDALEAFRLANSAMATAARKRTPTAYVDDAPSWRLFQLAFLLLNLDGVTDPLGDDREVVELIFFPTGGGKTEAYLGVIAYALILRRMRGRGTDHEGLGVAVLLRYTLRLLTLDQLARATTLICALEVLRREQPALLGETRFSIGLWVGQSATPNRFDQFVEALDDYKKGRRKTLPVPLEKCPWCGHELESAGLEVRPSAKKAERVIVRCLNAEACDFANPHPDGLPLVFIDEQVYRELPSFVIATVDKFAMMPWRGETALLFGRATSSKDGRFFGPLDRPPRGATRLPDGLPGPDVIVQDELHLITGPLGTMVGLYEIPVELLSTRGEGGTRFSPKIIASTATANHAREQIRALYGSRRQTSIFPPPAVDALETWFSLVNRRDPGRLYVGVAAPGHPIKRILLRVYLSLLTATKKLAADESMPPAQRDSMLTLVGYFNALRELGGMRRLVEDDIRTQARTRAARVPAEGLATNPWFADREIHEPLELTSRRSTGEISEAKARLENTHAEEKTTDVVLASNMISVGVDITRLGLMVVAGQPKTTSEYIQASSRVGRDRKAPGLVVTCFNVNRPRDRSHYEHFVAYHESFYRYVEAQSVTPFAPRALDRGLTGAFVAATRLSDDELTEPHGAEKLAARRAHADQVRGAFVSRSGAASATVDEWIRHRLDKWEELAQSASTHSARLAYSRFDLTKGDRQLLHLTLDPPAEMLAGEEKFSAPTSMRDVEPTVHLWLAQPGVAKKGR
ncbi:MAG: helicase [Sandaracinaceae bacterium]|nr:helicase [Sandaracinaceae bacterium]